MVVLKMKFLEQYQLSQRSKVAKSILRKVNVLQVTEFGNGLEIRHVIIRYGKPLERLQANEIRQVVQAVGTKEKNLYAWQVPH